MTQKYSVEIECRKCGHKQLFDVYDAVNVTTDPELRMPVLTGEIFLFECDECGDKGIIDYSLMYHDMDNAFIVQFVGKSDSMDEFIEAFNDMQDELAEDALKHKEDLEAAEEDSTCDCVCGCEEHEDNDEEECVCESECEENDSGDCECDEHNCECEHHCDCECGCEDGNIYAGYKVRAVQSHNNLIEKISIFEAGLDDRTIEFCKPVVKKSIEAQTGEEIDINRILFSAIVDGDHEYAIFNDSKPSYAIINAGLYMSADRDVTATLPPNDGHMCIIDPTWAQSILASRIAAIEDEPKDEQDENDD